MSANDSVQLRQAVPSDAPVIAAMSRDLVERGLSWRWRSNAIRRMIRDPECVVLCGRNPSDRAANAIDGFGIMQYAAESAHLNLLAVHPAERRTGIARHILEWLEQTASIAGIEQITLEVRARNSGAQAFYAKAGFHRQTYIPRYYDGLEAAYRMRKLLRKPFVMADQTSSSD